MKNKSYKWLSKVGLTLFAASILTGCADDNFSAPSNGDEVLLNFAVAEPTIVQTRADKDNDINNVTILVYNSSDELVSKQDYDEAVTETKFYKSFNLSAISSETGTLTFYALTNCKDKLGSISTSSAEGKKLSTLQAITDNMSGTALTMSAKVQCAANEITDDANTFVLNRNAAKLSVGIADPNEIEPAFQVQSIKVLNALPETYITTAADKGWGTGNVTTIASGDNNCVYMAPKADAKEISVLIYALYNNTPGWYRSALKGLDAEDRTKTKEIASIEANHYYQLLVNKVVGPGYATEDDAKNAALSNMELVVVDHAPKVMSLISTGTHTLGVPEKLEVNNIKEVEENLIIKTICKEGSTCSVTANPVVTVIEGSDWISINGAVTDGTGDNGDNNPEAPAVGKFWSQSLTIKPLVGGEYREGIVEVKWESLTRTVIIAQSGKFNGSALGTFTINMANNPNESTKSENYFDTFLKTTTVGVDKEAMCGVERTQGLHFPIGLQSAATDPGNTGTLTTYTYTLNGIKDEFRGSYKIYLKSGSRFSGKLKVGSETLSGNKTVEGNFDGSTSIEFSLTSASWDYIAEPRALVIEVTKGNVTTTFAYDLYQTGFFYKPGTETGRVEGSNIADKYYYYEVISVTANGSTKYWLDRNIGATAAGMYIEDANGANGFPGESNPFVSGSQGNLYGISNTANQTLDKQICPPGFRIPTVSEFNNLTASAQFKTVSDKTPVSKAVYWTSYYSDNISNRQIHFPKNRYVQAGGSKVGDGFSGYYWTRSGAIGASGSEVGKWWQAVKISGGAASTIRSRAWEGDNNSSLTGMSIRAVRNSSVDETLKSYKLQVTGYTNVYLYIIDETGTRVPLNNWPGDQILPYNGADETIDYDFNSYVEYSNVFVILNKIDKDGK
ncbi:MAG: hypothetical protein K2N34_06800, partial [Lachnospiraceae bacterium]|nr:hypothetical protein [Lachnospiraceae bacterium]